MTNNGRLRILICIGGGEQALNGLRFAVRLSHETCSDVALLYVRPLDSGLKSGGMEIRVARENVLDWGLELPGMTALKAARDLLAELGEISPETRAEWRHRDISGDPAGEYIMEYDNPCGGTVSLRLRTHTDVTSAAVDEAERFQADLIIVGGSPSPPSGLKKLLARKPASLNIAAHAKCPVIVARELEPEHGHLVCVQDSEQSRAMLPKAVRFAQACNCKVTILSVADDDEGLPAARKAVEHAASIFREGGIEPAELITEIGNASQIIADTGYDYSLIVVAESEKPWFAKGFSVSHDVAARARNSVMIIK